jgi:hypothetical protein
MYSQLDDAAVAARAEHEEPATLDEPASPAVASPNDDGDDADSSAVFNPAALKGKADDVLRAAAAQRGAVKGVVNFSQSLACLAERLTKTALSDAAIRKLEIGLSVAPLALGSLAPAAAAAGAPPQPASSTAAAAGGAAPPAASPAVPSVSLASPLRDALFRIGEGLIDVGRALEAVEAGATRLAVARARREMLVEQRDKLLRVAAARHPVPPAPGMHVAAA